MNEVQEALARLAQKQPKEEVKKVSYIGEDGKLHTVKEGERVPVLPVRAVAI